MARQTIKNFKSYLSKLQSEKWNDPLKLKTRLEAMQYRQKVGELGEYDHASIDERHYIGRAYTLNTQLYSEIASKVLYVKLMTKSTSEIWNRFLRTVDRWMANCLLIDDRPVDYS